MSKIDIDFLAKVYNKPVEYVTRCLKFHGIHELPKFRTDNDGFGPFYSDMTAIMFDPSIESHRSMTKQEFAAECDINNIMSRFKASGFDPSSLPITGSKARYGDFTSMPESYHQALSYIRDTERLFLTLPADFRARFENDPQKYLDFVSDPANADELVDLGILVRPAGSDHRGSGVRTEEPVKEGSTPSEGRSASKPVKKAPLEPSKGDLGD